MSLGYDAWLEWPVSPKCNLSCSYCWNRNTDADKQPAFSRIAAEIIRALGLSLSFRKNGGTTIDIGRLVAALNRSGRTFRVGLCGGEPFLITNILELCEAITDRHYISFSTNLSSEKIPRFVKRINPERVVWINASLHIKELERAGLLDVYVKNFHLCREAGFKIAAEAIAFPPLSRETCKYLKFFEGRGIKFRFIPFCGNYDGRQYPESYTDDERSAFGIGPDAGIKKFRSLGKKCNAGYNAATVDENGDVFVCYMIRDKIGNIYDRVSFKEVLTICPNEFCTCPLGEIDPKLREKALPTAGSTL